MFYEIIFTEACYHKCDDLIILKKYPLDRTFNTMRRDLYLERHPEDDTTYQEKIQWYIDKKHNHNLREFIRNNHNIEFYKLLETFGVLEFIHTNKIKIPQSFKIPIYNARFLYKEGNEYSILATDNKNYYYLKWSGS
jgi:hypothetical protein